MFDVVGKLNVPPLQIGATCVNVVVRIGLTVTTTVLPVKVAVHPVAVAVPLVIVIIAPFAIKGKLGVENVKLPLASDVPETV